MNRQSDLPALPPPMTVGRYVRENFKRRVQPYVAWASLSAPIFAGMRIKESGFAWWKLAAIPAAWAIACIIACAAAAIILATAGWWKLHTKISPYVPVTIAFIATMAVLVYRVS
ncbi:TPA: hypothetical protein ACOECI_000518 [Stenotrophomonas maltophilia]